MCKPRIRKNRHYNRWHWGCTQHLCHGYGRNWNDVLWDAIIHRALYRAHEGGFAPGRDLVRF